MQHHAVRWLLATSLAFAAATPVLAQDSAPGNDASFLRSFEGKFTGSGRLQRAGGSSHNLSCKFSGDQEGSRVVLNGTCSTALVFSTTVRIEIRHEAGGQRYEGTFREGTGTVAALAGSRQGRTLSLSFNETAESVRPGPPARLSISRTQSDMVLTLRGTKPGEGQNLDLTLRES